MSNIGANVFPQLLKWVDDSKGRFAKLSGRWKWGVFVASAILAAMLIKSLFLTPVLVPLAKVEWRDNFLYTASGNGQIRPVQEHYLTLKQGGKLDRVLVNVGDTVTAGQIIAIADETNGKAALASALSSYRLAAAEFGRIRALSGSGSATQQEMDEGTSKLSVKRSELQQAKQRLEDSLVRSPSAGQVSLLPFKTGDFVPEGSRIAVIEDRTSFSLVVKIDAAFRGRLPEVAKLKIQKFALTADAASEVQEIEGRLQLSSPTSNFDGLDVDVMVTLPSLPPGFAIGDAVSVEVPLKLFPRIALVERRALIWQGKDPRLVLLGKDRKLSWFTPELAGSSGDKLLIPNLAPGIQVVVPEETDKLKEYMAKGTRVSGRENS